MHFTDNFREAIKDYTLLLNKKYPEKSLYEVVSTRYALNQFERSMLFRGITTQEKAAKRKARLITIEQLNNQILHVDLFNALFTVAAYLRGYPVYLSNDGLLRDASESHGSGEWEAHLNKGLDLLLKSIENFKIRKAVFYIDNLLENGLNNSEKLKETVKVLKPEIQFISDPSPDHLIRKAKEGIIATSDSTIIDKSALPVFDLPRAALEFQFEPKLLRLDDIVMQ